MRADCRAKQSGLGCAQDPNTTGKEAQSSFPFFSSLLSCLSPTREKWVEDLKESLLFSDPGLLLQMTLPEVHTALLPIRGGADIPTLRT